MSTSKRDRPTTAELAVLRVLWREGASTVRAVHDAVYADTDVGYTTTLKLLQKMHAKRLVRRDTDSKQHTYEAAVKERGTLNDIVRHWMEIGFSGSSAGLAMQALEAKPISSSELAALKQLVERLEAKGKSS